MNQKQLERRRFVVAIMALSGAAGTALNPQLSLFSRAWAESPGQPGEGVLAAMVRMARLLYPHDALSETAAGAALAGQLDAAAAALDARAGGAWRDLDRAAQVEVMRGIETEAFFVAIQATVQFGVYNDRDFWKHVGYPGPSKGFGGYLHRGAGDIDWLPEKL